MATQAHVHANRLSFWQKMAFGLAIFIILGFAQFAARGISDFRTAPIWVHVHAALMLAWLALFAVQASLEKRAIALHRTLGWTSALLVPAIVAIGAFTGYKAVELQRVPFIFTPAYFLALTWIGVLAFAAMVAAALATRRTTQTHRRLMLGATVLLMEPALGRILPMPLIMPWGEMAAMVVQLATLMLLVVHDRRELGRVHGATLASIAVVIATHLAIEGAGRTAVFADMARAIAA